MRLRKPCEHGRYDEHAAEPRTIEPRLIPTRHGFLALTPDDCAFPHVGVEGETEDEARLRFQQSVDAWWRLRDRWTVREGVGCETCKDSPIKGFVALGHPCPDCREAR